MDFESIRALPFGDVLQKVAYEGGYTVGGFLGAGVLGRQVQDRIKPDAEVTTLSDGALAWAANNGPKIAVWYLLKNRLPDLVNAGVITSVAFDTLMRLLNSGKNPAAAMVMGYQVLGTGAGTGSLNSADVSTAQRLVQENSSLRTELSKMQQLIGPMDPRLPPYVGSSVMPPAERERKYAFMQPAIPGVTRPPGTGERERKYGFAGGAPDMSAVTAGRPGAAYVQAGRMFGMK